MCRVEPKVVSVYPPPNPPGISDERVALSAYYNWISRGCPEDHSGAAQDWFTAVDELKRGGQHAAGY